MKSFNNYELTGNSNRMSIINLDECESLLKQQYEIPENVSLIILKYEKMTGIGSEKSIQYEVYDPTDNYKRLNLSVCENSDIDIAIPIDIDEEIKNLYNDLKEDGYDLFDRNGKFYLDICTPFTADNGADILLADRLYFFFSKVANLTVCPSNCQYSTFSIDTQYLSCQCMVNNDLIDVENTDKYLGNVLYNMEDYKLKYTSYKTMKCYKLVFNFKLFIKNLGSIILSILLLIYIIFLISFLIKGLSPLKVAISKLWFDEENISNEYKSNPEINYNKYKDTEEKILNLKEQYPPKKQILKKFIKNNSENKDKAPKNKIVTFNQNNLNKDIGPNHIIIDAKGKSGMFRNEGDIHTTIRSSIDVNTKKHIKIDATGTKSFYININSESKFKPKKEKEKSEKIETKPKKKPKRKTNSYIVEKPIKIKNKDIFESSKSIVEKKVPKKEIILDDYELNHLNYLDALELDKRNYCRTYCSILMRDQLFLYTFVACNDYNLLPVKIGKFMIIIATLMAMNAFLFSDKSFHKLFISGVAHYLSYQILQILLSVVITSVVEVILCYLTLTDRHIYEIKAMPRKEVNGEKIFNILKCIRNKLFTFYMITSIMLLFYWYFISAFCAVYPNTQKIYLIDCLLSLLIFSIISFIVYALTTLFRVISLKDVNKKRLKLCYLIGQSFPIF